MFKGTSLNGKVKAIARNKKIIQQNKTKTSLVKENT